MTYTPNLVGRIVAVETETGSTRYVLFIGQRQCSPEMPTMTEAAMLAYQYGVEVVE